MCARATGRSPLVAVVRRRSRTVADHRTDDPIVLETSHKFHGLHEAKRPKRADCRRISRASTGRQQAAGAPQLTRLPPALPAHLVGLVAAAAPQEAGAAGTSAGRSEGAGSGAAADGSGRRHPHHAGDGGELHGLPRGRGACSRPGLRSTADDPTETTTPAGSHPRRSEPYGRPRRRRFPSWECEFDSRHPLHDKDPGQRPGPFLLRAFAADDASPASTSSARPVTATRPYGSPRGCAQTWC